MTRTQSVPDRQRIAKPAHKEVSSLSSLYSHIFVRGEIRAHDTTTIWSATEADKHEENEESVVEDEEPAEAQQGAFSAYSAFSAPFLGSVLAFW